MTVTRHISSPGSPQTPQRAKTNTPAPALNKPVSYFEKRNSGDLIPFEKLLRVKLPPVSSQGCTPVRPTPSPVARKQQPATDHQPLESKFDSQLDSKAGLEASQQAPAESSSRRHRTVTVSRNANRPSRSESRAPVEARQMQLDEGEPQQFSVPRAGDPGPSQQHVPVPLHERVVSVQAPVQRVVAPNDNVPPPVRSDFFSVGYEDRSYVQGVQAMKKMGVGLSRAARAGVDWLGAKCLGRLIGVLQFVRSVHDLAAAMVVQIPVAAVALGTRLVGGADPTGAPMTAASIFKATPLVSAAWEDMKDAVTMVRHGAAAQQPVPDAQQPAAAPQPTAPVEGNAVAQSVLSKAHASWQKAKAKAAVNVATASFVSRCLMVAAGVTTVALTAAFTAATFGAAPLAIAGFVLGCESVRLLAANAWCAYQNMKLARAGKAILPMGVNAVANTIYKQVKPTAGVLAPDEFSKRDREAKLRAADAANHVVGAQIIAGLAVGAAGQWIKSAATLLLKNWRWVASGTQSSMPMLEGLQAYQQNEAGRGVEKQVLEILAEWGAELRDVKAQIASSASGSAIRALQVEQQQLESYGESVRSELEPFGVDTDRLLEAAEKGHLEQASDLTIWAKDAQTRATSQGYPIFNQAVAAIAVERGLAGALLG